MTDECVQMKPSGAGVALHDSKNPFGPEFQAGADTWRPFLTGAKSDYFELPAPPSAVTGRTTRRSSSPAQSGRHG
ncbi:DUF397 domain-containing protein [Nonomuraea guangzhouensis]|uniref:DUF397 domain-containing protein n=1 Tax=Nonomuraea guangzhouensis TaxID=1291555 RepID=A0ABW4G2S3_9ACTN